MLKIIRNIAIYLVAAIVLAGCGSNNSDPGPLAGTWQSSGLVTVRLTFRDGEYEILGIITKASYKQQDNDVIMTDESGSSKGTSRRFTIVNKDTIRSARIDYHRIK